MVNIAWPPSNAGMGSKFINASITDKKAVFPKNSLGKMKTCFTESSTAQNVKPKSFYGKKRLSANVSY